MASGDVFGLTGTPRVFRDVGGDATMGLSGLAAGNLRESARFDFGAGARPTGFRVFARTQWGVAPTVQSQLEIYLAGWDDEATPGDAWAELAGADTNYSTAAGVAKREDCLFLGGPRARTSAVGPFHWGLSFVDFPFRWVSVLAYNNANQALATSGVFASLIRLTPRYPQIQG